MNKISENINTILSEWDPLDLGKDIATDEYRGYIPIIMKNINKKENLTHCLEHILINSLEVGYDKQNINHRNDLNKIVEKIMSLDNKLK